MVIKECQARNSQGLGICFVINLDSICRDQISFSLAEKLLRNYCVLDAMLYAPDIQNELRHDPFEEHVLSREADTYVNNFNVTCDGADQQVLSDR